MIMMIIMIIIRRIITTIKIIIMIRIIIIIIITVKIVTICPRVRLQNYALVYYCKGMPWSPVEGKPRRP